MNNTTIPAFFIIYNRNQMKNRHTDVVIIGGGISGLYAAQKCVQQGLHVTLLEKSTRLGGRICTVYGENYQLEAGAGRFASNHTLLQSLLKQYNLTATPNSKRYQYNGKPSPAQHLLKRVMHRVKQYPSERLMTMTFRQLCIEILGVHDTQLLITTFGYDAEFDLSNAYTTVDMFKRDFMTHTYFGCKEGLSELVHRMGSFVAQHARIYMSTKVIRIEEQSSQCIVHSIDKNGRPRHYKCSVVICAIPKSGLETLESTTQSQKALINKVSPVSLHRIYGKFPSEPKSWFSNVFRVATEDPIRQFIPINKQNGVAMISYSDTRCADYWKRHADRGNDHLKSEVLKHLHAVFPNVSHIPDPEWVKSFYWSDGVHLWKPGTDVDATVKKIQCMSDRILVAGEAFCKIQGWIEGALSSVEDVMPYVLRCV